jgi:hypothetical protein
MLALAIALAAPAQHLSFSLRQSSAQAVSKTEFDIIEGVQVSRECCIRRETMPTQRRET